MISIINKDFRDCIVPKGLTITDPPYNQGYHYNGYKDRISEDDYCLKYLHLVLLFIIQKKQ